MLSKVLLVALHEIGYKSNSLTEYVTLSQRTRKASTGRWKMAGALYKPIGSFGSCKNLRLSFSSDNNTIVIHPLEHIPYRPSKTNQ